MFKDILSICIVRITMVEHGENQNIDEQVKVILLVRRGRPKKDKEAEEKPQKKTESIWRDNPRLYFKMYYHNRPREECSCPHCGNKFDSKRSLGNHLYKSVLCKKIRQQQQEVTNIPS